MKKLKEEQMEAIVGGGWGWALGCLALGMVTGPIVGIACEMLNAEAAY